MKSIPTINKTKISQPIQVQAPSTNLAQPISARLRSSSPNQIVNNNNNNNNNIQTFNNNRNEQDLLALKKENDYLRSYKEGVDKENNELRTVLRELQFQFNQESQSFHNKEKQYSIQKDQLTNSYNQFRQENDELKKINMANQVTIENQLHEINLWKTNCSKIESNFNNQLDNIYNQTKINNEIELTKIMQDKEQERKHIIQDNNAMKDKLNNMVNIISSNNQEMEKMRIHIENLLMELEKKNMIFAISEKKHEEETKKQKADIQTNFEIKFNDFQRIALLEHEGLQKQIIELQEDIANKDKKNLLMNQEIDEKSNELHLLHLQNDNLTQIINNLKSQNAKQIQELKNEIDSMKNVTSYDKNLIEDSIKSLKQKNLELDLKLKEYSSSIDMYKNNIMEKNLEIESIKSQIIKDKMQLEGQIKILKTRLTDADQRNSQLHNLNQENETKLKQIIDENEKLQQNQNKDLALFNNNVKGLENQIRFHKTKQLELEDKISNQHQQMENINNKKNQKEEQIDALNFQIKDNEIRHTKELQLHSNEIDQLQKHITYLKDNETKQNIDKSVLITQIQGLKNKINELESQQIHDELEIKRMQDIANDRLNEIEFQKNQNQKTIPYNDFEKLKKANDQLKMDLLSSQQQNQKNESDYNQAQQKLNVVQDSEKRKIDEIESLNDQLLKRKKDISQLMEQLEQQKKSNSIQIYQITEMSAKEQQQNIMIQNLKEELKLVQFRLDQQKQQNQQQQRMTTEKNGELNDRMRQLDEIREKLDDNKSQDSGKLRNSSRLSKILTNREQDRQ